MEFQDYYAVLGIPKTATEKDIRSAFRKLARQYHPDVNPGNADAEAKFKQVNEAYQVLSDPEKRREYDDLAARYQSYQAHGGPRGGFDWGGARTSGARTGPTTLDEEELQDLFGTSSPFSDFFESLFGRQASAARGGPRAWPGATIEAALEVNLGDVYRGGTRQIALDLPGGRRTAEIAIPAGADDGTRIRLDGLGAPGHDGGPPGDLLITLRVRPDPRFTREEQNLLTRVATPLLTMLRGGEIAVPTPDGRRLALKVPAGTQDGRVFRLRGQGMPNLNNPVVKGDLLAELHVQIPERLTDQQRSLLEALAESLNPAGSGV